MAVDPPGVGQRRKWWEEEKVGGGFRVAAVRVLKKERLWRGDGIWGYFRSFTSFFNCEMNSVSNFD